MTPAPGEGNPVDTRFSYRGGELAQAAVSGVGLTPYTNTFVYRQGGEPYQLIRTDPTGTARYWYETDGRGDVVAVTSITGTVVDRYGYDQWGEPITDDRTNETVPQQLRYRGLYYDEALTYYWADGRYYDPEAMRYLQPASTDSRSYVYAGDDPIGRGSQRVGLSNSFTLQGNMPIVSGFNGGNAIDFNNTLSAVEVGFSTMRPEEDCPPEEPECDPDPGGVRGALRASGRPAYITGSLVRDLIKDSNLNFPLTARNALRALVGPLGTARAQVAKVRGQGADIRFYSTEGATVPSWLRECKSIEGTGGLTKAVQRAITIQGIRRFKGDLYIQAPYGTNGEEWVARIEGSLRVKGLESEAQGIRIQIANPSGRILIDANLYEGAIP